MTQSSIIHKVRTQGKRVDHCAYSYCFQAHFLLFSCVLTFRFRFFCVHTSWKFPYTTSKILCINGIWNFSLFFYFVIGLSVWKRQCYGIWCWILITWYLPEKSQMSVSRSPGCTCPIPIHTPFLTGFDLLASNFSIKGIKSEFSSVKHFNFRSNTAVMLLLPKNE